MSIIRQAQDYPSLLMKYFHRNSLICALMFSACCSSLYADDKSDAKDNPMAGLVGAMYSNMLDTLSKPETVAKMAHFHKL